MRMDFNDLESTTNLNQSFNATTINQKFLPEMKQSSTEPVRNLPSTTFACLTVLPTLFIIIGVVYRNSCLAKPHLPIFLIVFGILILVNLFIYNTMGATFLALIRRTRSFTSEKGIGVVLGTLLGILFGPVIFIWWVVGTIWWIKLTLSIKPQLRHPTSMAFCHPVVYWTALVANILGLIGFVIHLCIAIGVGTTVNKQFVKNRGG